MKIDLSNIEFPYYEGLDSNGYYEQSEVTININNFECVCNIVWDYQLYYEEETNYRYATLLSVDVLNIDFYDKENNPIEPSKEFYLDVNEKLQEEIKKQTNFKI